MSLPDLIRQDDPVKTLMEKTKIHEKAAKNIVTYIKENQAKTTLFSLLSKFGPAYGLTERIFKQYGENCLLQLMTNPYDVGMRFGMDFGVCDYIAKMRGEKFSDDPKRMTAAAFAVLVAQAETSVTSVDIYGDILVIPPGQSEVQNNIDNYVTPGENPDNSLTVP